MKTLIILLLALSGSTLSWAQKMNLDDNKKAVQGYDVVGYQSGYAIEGKSQFGASYQGATYYFYSEANKKTFLASPEKFVPAFGGWCAYAMGVDGSYVEIDPSSYKVINGKTYLFYKSTFNDTRAKWNKDEQNLLRQANKNWMKPSQK